MRKIQIRMGFVSLAVAASMFECKKPEPDKLNCMEHGVVIVCPTSIAMIQLEKFCVSIDEKKLVVIDAGKVFALKDGVSGIKTQVEKVDDKGLFTVKLSIPAGVTGHMIVPSCTYYWGNALPEHKTDPLGGMYP